MSSHLSSAQGSGPGGGHHHARGPATLQQHQGPKSRLVEPPTNKPPVPIVRDSILLTPYPVEPGHTLISILRLADLRPEIKANAAFVAEGDNEGIIINKAASIMDYNKTQAGQKERQQPPSAKMSFKVFLINSETGKLTLEHRTLRFWLDHNAPSSNYNSETFNNDDYNNKSTTARTFANIKQESSQLAQAYFCQLIGSKPDDDFPKNYAAFIMKLMRLLKTGQFARIIKMEVELRQLAHEDHTKPPSRASSIDGSQSGESSGRGSPLTSQRVLDIIESSYPNPISVGEICSTTQTDECIVRQFVEELALKEKISSTDNGQNFTRTTKPIDTKVNLVKQMPKVIKSQQPVIAIITAQYCEKLAVDSMISDKETFVRYRTTVGQDSAGATGGGGESMQPASANYVYTLGNIGDHRVVSTKLTSVGHSRGALIAAGNATTRLLGTFPEIEYVFLVGCGGGVVNYTDFASHVRLGDVVVSHLPMADGGGGGGDGTSTAGTGGVTNQRAAGRNSASSDYVYVHCRPKLQQDSQRAAGERPAGVGASIPQSYSVHRNLKRAATNGAQVIPRLEPSLSSDSGTEHESPSRQKDAKSTNGGGHKEQQQQAAANKAPEYDECHFRLWRPARLDLQELTQRLWFQGLEQAKHRIWEYYIDEGIKSLKQLDIDASRPSPDTDKLFMSIGLKDTIEVNHPEAAEDEIDLRREGRPMCHFGPIGSGKPAALSEPLKQRMVSEFGLRAFDSEFDPVVESIYGNCKESYVMIRGISDYKDGRKRKEWQQYSALVAAALMKSIIVNLKPLS